MSSPEKEIQMAVPTFIQAKADASVTIIAYLSNVTSGDFLLAVVQESGAVTSLTDTVGSTWQKLLSGLMNLNAGTRTVSVWWANAAASGANTVTVHTSGAAPVGWEIAEYTTAAIDVSSAFLTGDGQTAGSTITSNSITTTFANDILVGWAAGIEIQDVGSGFTTDTHSPYSGNDTLAATEHKTVSATGTYTASFAHRQVPPGNVIYAPYALGVISLYNPADYAGTSLSLSLELGGDEF
jgi:hypothetical protein